MFMIEKVVVGSRRHWTWILCLLRVIGVGFLLPLATELRFGNHRDEPECDVGTLQRAVHFSGRGRRVSAHGCTALSFAQP